MNPSPVYKSFHILALKSRCAFPIFPTSCFHLSSLKCHAVHGAEDIFWSPVYMCDAK